eukprot:5247618-Lingulodinium_polyedra.AAC.1
MVRRANSLWLACWAQFARICSKAAVPRSHRQRLVRPPCRVVIAGVWLDGVPVAGACGGACLRVVP